MVLVTAMKFILAIALGLVIGISWALEKMEGAALEAQARVLQDHSQDIGGLRRERTVLR